MKPIPIPAILKVSIFLLLFVFLVLFFRNLAKIDEINRGPCGTDNLTTNYFNHHGEKFFYMIDDGKKVYRIKDIKPSKDGTPIVEWVLVFDRADCRVHQ